MITELRAEGRTLFWCITCKSFHKCDPKLAHKFFKMQVFPERPKHEEAHTEGSTT